MEQKMPAKRKKHYGIIVALTVLLTLLLAYLSGFEADHVFVCLMMAAIFLAVILYMLESSRLSGKLGRGRSDYYGRIADWYGICCAAAAGCYFLPVFTFPAAAAALFLAMASNAEIAITLSAFLSVILCTARGGGLYELAAYCILALIGAQMAKTMRNRKLRFLGCILLASVSVCIPVLFYYLSYESYSVRVFLINAVLSAAWVLLYKLLADQLYDKKSKEDVSVYEKIIHEEYPYVVDMMNYSRAEYVHAVKAATLAGKCAALIGANELAAAAAGFYYRLGILEGEPFVENGVRLAQEGCFPEAVIEILSEYNGEEKLPSTRESAIVHMVDACIKKMEMLHAQKLSSSWNQEMVIYQTLNELSSTGIYDESGLSMNQFLKVRELLVHEEIIYDNSNGRRDSGGV